MRKTLGKKVLALAAALVVTAGMTAPAAARDGRAFADTGSRSAANVSVSSDEQALKEAKEAYIDAEAAYQALGFEFVNSRTTSGSSYSAIKSAIASDSSLSEYVGSGMDEGVVYALASDNVRKSIRLVKELNNLRARSDNAYGSVGPLKIDCDLMMYSAFSGYISESTHNHTLYDSGVGAPAVLYSECLAWGYDDPFDGWYHAEKKVYDENPNADHYRVGHYLNSVDPDASTVGLTVSDGTAAMDIGSASGSALTVDEFESAFNAYTSDAKEKRDEAKAEYNRIYKAYKARRHVGKVTQKNPRSGRASFTVRWNRVKNANGYQIQYSRNWSGGKKITVRDGRTTSRTIRGIARKKTYFVRVRAYRVVDGRKFYGKWSNVRYGYGW